MLTDLLNVLSVADSSVQKHAHSTPPASAPAPAPAPNPAQQAIHQQQYSKPAPPLPTEQYGGRRPSPQMQPPANYGYGSPPPQNYGFSSPPLGSHGPRPHSGSASRPQPMSRPPPSPAPPAGADPALWPLFKAVDKDGDTKYIPLSRQLY